jgi:hypothetical protein
MKGNRPDQEARDAFAEASDQAERLLADLEDCGPPPVPWRLPRITRSIRNPSDQSPVTWSSQ